MSPTVPDVLSWSSAALRATADSLDEVVERLDEQLRAMTSRQAFLNGTWTGVAASAAMGRIGIERSLASAISAVLLKTAAVYRAGAWQAENAREMVLQPVRIAEDAGYEVQGDGIVDPSAKISWITLTLPEIPRREVLILDIRRDAAALSVEITTGLREAARAGQDVCRALGGVVDELLDAAKAAAPTPAVKPAGREDNEGFSIS